MTAVARLEPARAARTLPAIQVHLTPYAPECANLQVDNPKRWRTFYDRPAASVMRTLLTRLRRTPAQVRVRTEDPPLFDIDLMAEVDGVDAPIATLCSGVTAAEVTTILAQLTAAGWRPSTVLEIVT